MFIPHNNLKSTFEEVAAAFRGWSGIEIELVHVFGTPQTLAQNGDADILVARGMTYDWLRNHFPEKHVIEIRFSSFDILDALLSAKKLYHPQRIAVLIRNLEERLRLEMEEICGASILYFKIRDESTAVDAVLQARDSGAEVFVGAGTVCGICDREGLTRIHIHTQKSAVERALREAVEIALTMNRERARNTLSEMILNTSPDGLLSLDATGRVQAMNNRAFRLLNLSVSEFRENIHLSELCPALRIPADGQDSEVISFEDGRLYVESTPILVDGHQTGTLLTIRDTSQITAAEGRIRQGLVRQGLAAKYTFKNILGKSPQIQHSIQTARRYARADSNVLIVGETGTGKELFAHSIHQESRRRSQPFVALNCAALPESLLESELFGYEPGAFSGASRSGKIGLFELANKGTIFLDEIGEIPVSLQAKLLRVLQEQEIRRIGSTKVISIDVRVIAATNINIRDKIRDRLFRSDLYYRLNVLNLSLPPLRDRGEDIRLIAEYYLTRCASEIGIPFPRLSGQVLSALRDYTWPGNVRELRNICERIAVLSAGGEVQAEDLDLTQAPAVAHDSSRDRLRQVPAETAPEPAPSGGTSTGRDTGRDTALPAPASETGGPAPSSAAASPLPSDVDPLLLSAPQRESKSQKAKQLGISRTTLWRREKRLRELREKG